LIPSNLEKLWAFGIRAMRQFILLTGSGISADSGLDTFRSSGGQNLWARYDPEIVCNFDVWEENFELVHDFYSKRRMELGKVKPNAAHKMAAKWQKRFGAELITQNVDDLFERAGAQDVIHVHGHLTGLRCLACETHWNCGYKTFDPATDRCPQCGGVHEVKPDVVFFNERAPLYQKLWEKLDSLSHDDLLVIVGTSGNVLPIAGIACHSRAVTVLSNLESEPAIPEHYFDHVLHGRAAKIAPQLDALVKAILA
jgi:NAD-dependent deacetylase